MFAIWTTLILALGQLTREHELYVEQFKNQQAAKDLEIQAEKFNIFYSILELAMFILIEI